MKKNYIEPYKKLILTWYQVGVSYKHYKEKLIITKDKINFKRTVECSINNIDECFNTCKWSIKIEDESYVGKFFLLCENFVNHCDNYKLVGNDLCMLDIELVLDDNTKIKEHYMGSFKENDLKEFSKLIKEFIPKFVSKPYMI